MGSQPIEIDNISTSTQRIKVKRKLNITFYSMSIPMPEYFILHTEFVTLVALPFFFSVISTFDFCFSCSVLNAIILALFFDSILTSMISSVSLHSNTSNHCNKVIFSTFFWFVCLPVHKKKSDQFLWHFRGKWLRHISSEMREKKTQGKPTAAEKSGVVFIISIYSE